MTNFLIAPRGFEPLSSNQKATVNKKLTRNSKSHLSTSLDNILQNYPDLGELVERWPNRPEHIKATIEAISVQLFERGRLMSRAFDRILLWLMAEQFNEEKPAIFESRGKGGSKEQLS